MGAWGVKALESDEGLDVIDILANEYVPRHPVMDLGEIIRLMKEQGMLGEEPSQIDFLFDNTVVALAELYFRWKDDGRLDYGSGENVWENITGFTASKDALSFLLRQLTDIKNQVPDEDGIREIVELWKNEDSGEIDLAWLEHLGQLIGRLASEQAEKEQDMGILQQCQKWHENGEYQKIIDALEAISAQERTPEMDSELARAYNNLATPGEPDYSELLRKAIALLKPHEEYFAGDYFWNFRMGYSYYFLDQEGRALRYFEKALEARPDDEDTKEFISWCKKGISWPQFSECFRERTENWWETFAEQEAELRQMMDEDKNLDLTRGAEIAAQMEEILNLVFDEISFEMGFNGEKYELILTPEGDKVKLFELVYFQRHAPEKVLEHWNILVGRKPIRNIGLRTDDGWDISGKDVQIWLEEQGKNSFAISAYCEKLLPMLQEEEGRAWWMLTTLTDQVLGEIPHMRYIDNFDVLDTPKAEPSIFMSQLPDKLREKGLDLSTDPEAYLENYTGYQMKPKEDPEADWRLDVMVGSTSCAPLINGYLNAGNDFIDELHADSVVAGFFCYPLDTLREEEGSQKIFNFRDKLEEALTAGDAPETPALIGGATGLFCGYVDFIAWDIQETLRIAREFFGHSDIPWAVFHTFRREAGAVTLKDVDVPDDERNTEKQEEALPEMDSIPYAPQNAEAFFQQLEQWNDADEFTKCIEAIEAIPEGERGYQLTLLLGRAYSNLAVLGDHRELFAHLDLYDKADMDTIEAHIETHFGKFDWIMHETIPGEYVHLDICVIPPREDHNYYTLVTMGMGAYTMNAPEKDTARAELLINLPPDWNLGEDAWEDEHWFWPVGILKALARYPMLHDDWLGWGHTVCGSEDSYTDNTKLCGVVLLSPGAFGDPALVCTLPNGEPVNFYQVIPLYREEIEFKREYEVDRLLEKFPDELLEVIDPSRPNVITDAAMVAVSSALDEAEAMAEKTKAFVKGVLADKASEYYSIVSYFMEFHQDDLPEDMVKALFPVENPSALTLTEMADYLQLKRFGSFLDGETKEQRFILDLTFDPEITNELLVIYFNADKQIVNISHES